MLKKLTKGVFSAIGLSIGYIIAETLLEIPQIAELSYFSKKCFTNQLYNYSFYYIWTYIIYYFSCNI